MSAAALLRSQVTTALGTRFDVSFTIGQRRHPETLSTGIAEVDHITGGGIPRSAFTEISGPESSGRTTIATGLLAGASQKGEFCALIDACDSFDPVSASAAGVRLEQLLWIRCGGPNAAESALKTADLIVQAGGFGLILMDLGGTPEILARRISLASWFRLRHAVERTHAALVVTERQINARSCSALQLEMRRPRPLWKGKRLAGAAIELENCKHYRSQSTGFEARW